MENSFFQKNFKIASGRQKILFYKTNLIIQTVLFSNQNERFVEQFLNQFRFQ